MLRPVDVSLETAPLTWPRSPHTNVGGTIPTVLYMRVPNVCTVTVPLLPLVLSAPLAVGTRQLSCIYFTRYLGLISLSFSRHQRILFFFTLSSSKNPVARTLENSAARFLSFATDDCHAYRDSHLGRDGNMIRHRPTTHLGRS